MEVLEASWRSVAGGGAIGSYLSQLTLSLVAGGRPWAGASTSLLSPAVSRRESPGRQSAPQGDLPSSPSLARPVSPASSWDTAASRAWGQGCH